MVRKANLSDINKLAQIHLSELNSDFLPSLGIKFLRALYLDLATLDRVYILVYEQEGKVEGFIVGSKDFDKDFKKIITGNFIRYSFLIFPQIIKTPFIVKNILETFLYTKKEGKNLPNSELVIIAISEKYHHRGIGKKLVLALDDIFAKEKISRYKVSVNKKNAVANKFYNALGFRKHSEFSLYGKIINLYIKQIK